MSIFLETYNMTIMKHIKYDFIKECINSFDIKLLESKTPSYNNLKDLCIFRIFEVGTDEFSKDFDKITEGILDKVKSWFNKSDDNTVEKELEKIKNGVISYFETVQNIYIKISKAIAEIKDEDTFKYSDINSILNNIFEDNGGLVKYFTNIGKNLNKIDSKINGNMVLIGIKKEYELSAKLSNDNLGKLIKNILGMGIHVAKANDEEASQKVRLLRGYSAVNMVSILGAISLLPQLLKLYKLENDNAQKYFDIIKKYDVEETVFNLHLF